MIVRIRFGRGAKAGKKSRKQNRFAMGLAGLLSPAAALASVFGLWRIAADLNWTGTFAISGGFFSHWQVWMGTAVLLQLCAHLLNRYARGDESPAS